jgi:hypothetical protein
MLLILSTNIANYFVLSKNLAKQNLEHTLFGIFWTLPPFIAFGILGEALWKLKCCGGENYSLSTKHIIT